MRYPPTPNFLTPSYWYTTYTQSAKMIGRPITEVPAMLRNGITPVMLKTKTAKKIVVIIGTYFLPSFSPRIS